MKIQCINSGNNKLITKGNEYEVIAETEDRFTLLNDKGIQKNYARNLFEVEIIPLVKKVDIIDGLEAETSIVNSDKKQGFSILIKIKDKENYTYEEGYLLDISTSDISCGIKTVSGVDGLMNFVDNFKQDFSNYLDENIEDFKIDEDFDFDSFYKEIVDLLIDDLIEEYRNECLFLLLSTNLTNNEFYNEDVINSLNENSEIDLFGINPNSENDIKLWVLKCN